MSPRIPLILILILCGELSWSQQLLLKGQVSVHNSRYETGAVRYVQDAYITAPFTKPVNSDSEGKFQMQFVGLEPGTSVELRAEKAGLEVVNDYTLKDVVINRKAPVRVFLIEKGKLAQAQTELYNISKKALYARKDAIIASLRKNDAQSAIVIKELEAYFGHPIKNRFEAETELIERIQTLEKRLPEFAQNLAQQNLDFASERYIKAYEFLRAGQIEQAIETLDSLSLARDYTSALKTIAAGNELSKKAEELKENGQLQLKQLIASYDLRAKSHYLLFDYAEAANALNQTIKIHLENDLPRNALFSRYLDLAQAYYDDGKFEVCLATLDKVWHEVESETAVPIDIMARLLIFTADVNTRLARYEEAEKYHHKDIAFRQKNYDSLSGHLAESYNRYGFYLYETGQDSLSLVYTKRGLAIRQKQSAPDKGQIAESMNNLGLVLHRLDRHKEGFVFDHQVRLYREQILEPNHPWLALSYSNLGFAHMAANNLDSAVVYLNKALDIRRKILNPIHPDLASTISTVGVTYGKQGEWQLATPLLEEALEIRKQCYDSLHPRLALSYNLMSTVYNKSGSYEKSLTAAKKANRIFREVNGENSYNVAATYSTMAAAYSMLDRLDKAIELSQLSIKTLGALSKDYSGRIAIEYNNQGVYYIRAKKYDLAYKPMSRALEIFSELPSDQRSRIARSHLRLADIQYHLGKKKAAKSHLKLADDILSKFSLDELTAERELRKSLIANTDLE